MDRSDVIKLVPTTSATDEYGVGKVVEGTPREILCQVRSVTRNEFFEGGRNGLNPEYEFDVFFGDYDGERLVEYNGLRYSVYRTYHGRNDTIELYCERKGGTNG